jgi:hypothetical protein
MVQERRRNGSSGWCFPGRSRNIEHSQHADGEKGEIQGRHRSRG